MSLLALGTERLVGLLGTTAIAPETGRVRVRPSSGVELAEAVRVARALGLPVRVGAREGFDLDLGRMASVLELDETSLLATAQAGATWAAVEEVLAERGLTLGALPGASRGRTLGALLAAPRPSEASPRMGAVRDQCAALMGVLPDGTIVESQPGPRRATGPELTRALVGARGALGVVTSVTLRVRRRGERALALGFALPGLEPGLLFARALLLHGVRPRELWVAPPGAGGPARAGLVLEGDPGVVEAERAFAVTLAGRWGGHALAGDARPAVQGGERASAHERFVPLAAIGSARAGGTAAIVGWHLQGATVRDPARAPDPAPLPPLVRALMARLDPAGLMRPDHT